MQVRAETITCRRAGRLVLDRVSFEIGPGEALVVTGRNGAGKSTLLAALAGLVGLEAGTIRTTGTGERGLPECLHLVGHRDALKASLTAGENLRFAADILGEPRLGAAAALARVGLPEAADLPVAYLSAGQRRRVALARLLVAHRPLWLLDEPTTALDAAAQDLLLGLMVGHLDGGGLIVAASHVPLPLVAGRELHLGRGGSA